MRHYFYFFIFRIFYWVFVSFFSCLFLTNDLFYLHFTVFFYSFCSTSPPKFYLILLHSFYLSLDFFIFIYLFIYLFFLSSSLTYLLTHFLPYWHPSIYLFHYHHKHFIFLRHTEKDLWKWNSLTPSQQKQNPRIETLLMPCIMQKMQKNKHHIWYVRKLCPYLQYFFHFFYVFVKIICSVYSFYCYFFLSLLLAYLGLPCFTSLSSFKSSVLKSISDAMWCLYLLVLYYVSTSGLLQWVTLRC